MKQDSQSKYLRTFEKSGCVSADYLVNDNQDHSMIVLFENVEKSGSFREPNKSK
jgi:hypothetical protein